MSESDWERLAKRVEAERDEAVALLAKAQAEVVWPDGAKPAGPDADPLHAEIRLAIAEWQAAETRQYDQAVEATGRALRAERERDEAVALLRDVEWNGGLYDQGRIARCCPCCGREPVEGHNAVCRLDAFLAPAQEA